jgi:uncharacterized protein YacL
VVDQRGEAVPHVVVEVLRFCIVLFFAGLGSQVAELVASADQVRVGPLDAAGLGVVLGAAVGYVLGGVLGRLTGRSVAEAESALAGRTAEQVLAGMAGAVLGVLLSAGVTWPVLLLGSPAVTLPVFAFVCVALGTLGYRVGLARRAGMLALIGSGTRLHVAPHPLSTLPRVVDSSVAIDGRVLDVVRAGFLHGVLLVPKPVLDELQGLADAGDESRRMRGRRGLDVLTQLRSEPGVDVEVIGDEALGVPEVDAKLVRICLDRRAALLTLDGALAKVAALAGCRVMNLHALAQALRPPVAAGDGVTLLVSRAGREPGQGVGYLDDGTMVVVEQARERVGSELSVQVTSVLTTANGRMVFARPVRQAAPVGAAPGPVPAPPVPPAPRSPR